jgi:methane monooxygenase PmoA-like
MLVRSAFLACCAVLICVFAGSAVQAGTWTLEKNEHGVTVKLDGKLFTAYVIDNGPKPILWPIIGPTGAEMTRAYPMKNVPGERQDHPHHRSLWFTHMVVNGVNFWGEAASYKGKSPELKKLGKTEHAEFTKVAVEHDRPIISTRNRWVGPDGALVLEDERTVRCFTEGESRVIDFDIVLLATQGPVTFGDNKDGVFGIRIPTSMDVDSKQGGQIVNSEGQVDKDAWGKAARWCDYHGPVEGQTVGIAVLNHPSSFRYPTPWHVRTYGLFAANCFGLHDFNPQPGVDGTYTLPKGERLPFRYRVILHRGDQESAGIESAFERYAAETK